MFYHKEKFTKVATKGWVTQSSKNHRIRCARHNTTAKNSGFKVSKL